MTIDLIVSARPPRGILKIVCIDNVVMNTSGTGIRHTMFQLSDVFFSVWRNDLQLAIRQRHNNIGHSVDMHARPQRQEQSAIR